MLDRDRRGSRRSTRGALNSSGSLVGAARAVEPRALPASQCRRNRCPRPCRCRPPRSPAAGPSAPATRDRAVDAARTRRRRHHDAALVRVEVIRQLHHHAMRLVRARQLGAARGIRGPAPARSAAVQLAVAAAGREIGDAAPVVPDGAAAQFGRRWAARDRRRPAAPGSSGRRGPGRRSAGRRRRGALSLRCGETRKSGRTGSCVGAAGASRQARWRPPAAATGANRFVLMARTLASARARQHRTFVRLPRPGTPPATGWSIPTFHRRETSMTDRFLDGRTALVTGATSGIGLAIAAGTGCGRRAGRHQRPRHAGAVAAALASVDAAGAPRHRGISTPTCATPPRSRR